MSGVVLQRARRNGGEEIGLPAIGGGRLALRRCCIAGADHGDDGELGNTSPGKKDALGVRARIRRGNEESGGIEQREVVCRNAFQNGLVLEGHAQPDAGEAGAAGEGCAQQVLRIGGLTGVEVANEAGPLEGCQRDELSMGGEVQQLQRIQVGARRGTTANETGGRQIAGEPVSIVHAEDGFFLCAGHSEERLRSIFSV